MQQRNLVWLASYPKSGNTWFRAFLTALLNESEDIDLNGLKTDGIFSSRGIFEALTDIDSTYLYDAEVKNLMPEVFTQLSNEVSRTHYIKVHDAYTLNSNHKPLIPASATKCAVYIIRNPLDIVASFANHMGSTLEHAIKVMNNPQGTLATQSKNHNTNIQFRQLMLSWSEHVNSWNHQTEFPVLTIRYEDMLNDSLHTFRKAVRFMSIDIPDEQIIKAIEATSFNKLREKEQTAGFREKNAVSPSFFRSGKSGNWINELTKEQAENIVTHHSSVMKKFGYSIELPTSLG